VFLDDIGDWLQSQGVATKGVDLFKSMDPGQPDTAVILYEYAGISPIDTMGTTLATTLEQPSLHVLVRGVSYVEATSKAKAVFRALHKLTGSINGVRYLYLRALQSPFDVGPDERGRPRLVCNFRAIKELSV
jgi:hypothetical protein